MEQKFTMTARQKVGRGLRLCVNQDGERIEDRNINILHVMANESFAEFADNLLGCGRVCPANNIKLSDEIVFGNKCETCYACVNLCPSHAIYTNKATLKRRQYRNPIVSVDEIIEANSK